MIFTIFATEFLDIHSMKKTLFFALALAAICLMPSCKKYASEIAFGDTAGMRVATYDKTDMQSEHYESYYEIDLNNDGQCDIKLYSQLIASAAIGDPIVSYIKCKNKDIALLGDVILQEHYIHTDTTVTVQEGVTFQRITRTHTCERVDDADIVEDSKEKLSLTAATAGESFGLEDSFLSTEVALNGFSYGFCDDPEEISANFFTQVCNNYNDDCDSFPMDKEQYIGFKFTIDGRDHLGWIMIILEGSYGNYYVRPIESAVQR